KNKDAAAGAGVSETAPIDDADLMEEYREYLEGQLPFLDFAPIAFITAKESRNVQGLLDLTQHLYNQANERLSTGRLNRAIKEILEQRTPSSPSGRRVKIYYATQVQVAPPTIALFVNNPEFLDAAYQRFMINRFRELLPYAEVPIKLILRGREGGKRAGAEAIDHGDQAPAPARR